MRLRATIAAVCLLTSVPLALPGPRPAFDPRAVVRQTRQAARHQRPTDNARRRSSAHAARTRRPVRAQMDGRLDGEFLVDTSITLMPGPFDRSLPAVAFDGTNFLLVWEDDRGYDWYYDIYGARVTPDGTVLDPAGIAICEATDDQNCPAVTFDGTNFLVVWEDYRSYDYLDIYGARVTPQGAVLDPEGFAVSTARDDQYSAAVASDGENCLVVWEDYRGDYEDIYGARVTPQGTVMDPSGIPISQATKDQCYPDVGFDGSNFLVVWEDYRGTYSDIFGARVTPEGTVLDPSGIAVAQAANSQYCPAVDFVGGRFLVAWEDYRAGCDVYGARVTPEGALLDPAGIVISQAGYGQYAVSITCDSTNFFVCWQDERDSADGIFAARVTPSGSVLDSSGIDVSTARDYQSDPVVAFGSGKFLVAWTDDRVGEDIFGARVTPQGATLDSGGFIISMAAQDQYAPAVGFDGSNYLVVWEDGRSVSFYENYDIYGARVTPLGEVLDPAGFAVSQSAGDQFQPAVAYDGTSFLVTWLDCRRDYYGDIYGARVTPAGAVLDTGGIAISLGSRSQANSDVCAGDSNFLVVWEDSRNGGYSDIYGARVMPNGTVLDPSGIAIAVAARDQTAPAVCSDGANCLVVWQDDRDGSGWHDIYGMRVTPAGTLLDSSGLIIAPALYDQVAPDLSFDGTDYLAVWEDVRSAMTWDIYGARVTPAGEVLDTGIAICDADGDQGTPVVDFGGANFLVAWEDFRNSNDWDIYGGTVTPAGVVCDTGPIVTQGRDQVLVALACAQGGQTLVVYQGWTGKVNGRGYCTHRIWGKLAAYDALEEGRRGPRVSDRRPMATVIREVPPTCEAYDAMGRRVANPRSGVLFIRERSTGSTAPATNVRKVVVQR